jgi:PST family polysaccharide transporter
LASLLVSTIKGLKWTSFSQIGRQILQYLTTLILVGLISPDEFGTMAMAVIVIGFLDIFKDLGTGAAIIQIQTPSEELKSSIFWINILIGLVITAIIYYSSPVLASIYNSPEVQPVLKVLSITFFISSFSILQKSLLEKEFHFPKLSTIELISSSVGFSVAIVMAFKGFGVWSLVFQVLVNAIISTVLIWIKSNWRPKFHLRLNDIKTISNFSFNLVGFNIINYFARNGDYFLIGKYLGDRELGHYYLAYRIMLYPIRNITAVISRVLYPSYSQIQNDNAKIGNVFTNTTNAIALFTFPMMAGIGAVSFIFTDIFFSGTWNTESVAYLILILAPVGALQSVISPVGNIYKIKSKTDWMFRWSLFASSLTILGFIIGLRWGVIGVALSYLITNLLLLYPVFRIPFGLIGLSVNHFFKTFVNTIFTTILMVIFIEIISLFISDSLATEIKLVLLILSGIIFYILTSLLFNKRTMKNMKQITNKYLQFSKNSEID